MDFTKKGFNLLTNGESYGILLSGKTIVIIKIKSSLGSPVTYKILFHRKENAEMTLTANNPNRIFGGFIVASHLK